MPIDLTGSNLSDVYTSFLHLSTNSLSAVPQSVCDGIGNISTLSLSTSSVHVSANFFVGSLKYPQVDGGAGTVITSDGNNNLTLKSISQVLTAISTFTNGTYSSPVITIADNIITNIQASSGSRKTFFLPSRNKSVTGPTTSQLIAAITWANPVANDKAFVIQKVMYQGNIVDLSINEFTYSGTAWGSLTTY